MKTCRGCKNKKALKDFYKHPQMSDGRLNYCKNCIITKNNAHYHSNKDEINNKSKTKYQKIKDREVIKVFSKKCSICKSVKDIKYFHKRKSTKDGYREQCKTCRKNIMAEYYIENESSIVASVKQREEHIKRATPPWADLEAIKKFYENRPKGYHVDHIIPLRAKTACGLHVLSNLQYLPAEENLKKGNRIIDVI